jgi:hypothetical protein
LVVGVIAGPPSANTRNSPPTVSATMSARGIRCLIAFCCWAAMRNSIASLSCAGTEEVRLLWVPLRVAQIVWGLLAVKILPFKLSPSPATVS